ncbi:hypothetical protein IFM89_036382 [Coptis chinensis]|uniref:Uncharacterized protein n=1 Tax=Coptis chinensis TaxID=261450 RepID=A0A835IGQ6_9MAGN|nr:hypothetical protein IFM89_036382 [Coptis chinensis]
MSDNRASSSSCASVSSEGLEENDEYQPRKKRPRTTTALASVPMSPSTTSAFNEGVTTSSTNSYGNLLQQDHNQFSASCMSRMPMQQPGLGKNASQEAPQPNHTSNNLDLLLDNDIDWESVYLKASQASQEDCQQNFDGNLLQQDHNQVLTSSMPNVELNRNSVPSLRMPMASLDSVTSYLADGSLGSTSGVVAVPLDGGLMQQAGDENFASQEAPELSDMLDNAYDPSIFCEDLDWNSVHLGELPALEQDPQPVNMLMDFSEFLFEEDPQPVNMLGGNSNSNIDSTLLDAVINVWNDHSFYGRICSNLQWYHSLGFVYNGRWFLKGLGSHRQVPSEVYHPENDIWYPVPNGMVSGWRNSSAFLDGHLYALDCKDGCKLRIYNSDTDSWSKHIDSKLYMGSSRALEATALLPLNGKLCIIRNNMRITMVDVSKSDNAGEVIADQLWETIAGKGQFKKFVANLVKFCWS